MRSLSDCQQGHEQQLQQQWQQQRQPGCTQPVPATGGNSHLDHQQQQHEVPSLHLFVYEPEPELLARHMLLLAVLFDATLTSHERAEAFMELHGNILLRQRTADWLGRTDGLHEECPA